MRQEDWPELMTADEVAPILRVSKYSLYRWAAGGTPASRLGIPDGAATTDQPAASRRGSTRRFLIVALTQWPFCPI